MRSRELLEVLSSARAGPAWASEPTELNQVLSRIVLTQRLLLDPRLTNDERSRALEELSALELDYEDLGDEIARGQPPVSRLPQPDFATLHRVQESLAPNEAMLSFQVSLWKDIYGRFMGGSWLLVSTASETRAIRLPGRERLEQAITIFRGLFDWRDGSESAPAMRLYRDLLEDAVDSLPKRIDQLIIIPDGVLHSLPFAALRDPDCQHRRKRGPISPV